MDLDDPAGYSEQFRDALAKVDESDLADADTQALRRFALDRESSLAASSLSLYLTGCRTAAGFAPTPLTELDADAYREMRSRLRTEADLAEATVNGYCNAVQAFLSWYDDANPVVADLSWEDAAYSREVDSRDMLTPADITTLRQAATRQRDIALIEFFADTGARRSLAASLRVGDVALDAAPPTYRPNPDAIGLKGVTQSKRPLIDSPAPIRNYLRSTHPRPDDDEAPLWHIIPGKGGRGKGDRGLTADAITNRLRSIGADAGLEKPTNPHNFRHSAVTRMLREGYSREEIAHRVGWEGADSDMFEHYQHIADEELNEDIARKAGLVADDDGPERVRTRCGQCHGEVAPHHDHCPTCGAPVSREARQAADTVDQTALDDLATSDLTPEERRVVSEVLRRTRAHEDPSSSESS